MTSHFARLGVLPAIYEPSPGNEHSFDRVADDLVTVIQSALHSQIPNAQPGLHRFIKAATIVDSAGKFSHAVLVLHIVPVLD